MKKYIGKLKSFKELMCMADGLNANRELKFLSTVCPNFTSWNIMPKEFEQYCDKEMVLLSTGIPNKYKTEFSKYVVMNEWFSEIKEIEDSEVWKPKEENEEIYIVTAKSEVVNFALDFLSKPEMFIKNYNCWKMKEEAEKVEKTMKLYRAMKRWSFDNDNGYEFDNKKQNWEILYNLSRQTWIILDVDYINVAVVFSTESKAKQCLEWLKKENLI